jgi:trigger factor
VKVSSQRIPDSQVVLEIEVDDEQMERSLERAYRRLVQRVEVPGFRKGKTPRSMLERHIGRRRLLQEAIDILVPEVYTEALDKEGIDPIGEPAIEVLREEPLSFKATVPVRPTVELGDYKQLRVPKEEPKIDESTVEESLQELRKRYALYEPVDRPVQTGDVVTADVRIVIEGREVFRDEDAEFRLREGATVLLPGFAEGLVGARKGEQKEIAISVPPGRQPLSGKSGVAYATVKEVKEERLPDLDDDFARAVGEGFPSLDALRQRLRDDLRERVEAEAEEDYRERALSALAAQAEKIEFPYVMVDREIHRLLEEQARSAGLDVESYLRLINRTAEELHKELEPAASERVRRSLALGKLAEQEDVGVTSAEVDAEIERIVATAAERSEEMRRLFSSPEARAAVERNLLTRKTFDRLVEIAGQSDGTETKSGRKMSKTKAGVKKEER